jgi:Ice-binding-like
MSIGYSPKNNLTLGQSLRIQELSVSGSDYQLYKSVAGTPIVTSDQYLGIAGNYGVLAASALTNSVGTSVINGNLGISPNGPSFVTGSFTVSGSSDEGNAAAALAQVAAVAAFNSLQTLGLAGTTIPAELGGQTLNSPVAGATVAWQSSTSFGISLTSGHSTLTLNGPGKFVIYSPSTLVTGASGSTDVPVIALTGGALAKNVYFVVGSSATINQSAASAGATFNGNVIAHTSITTSQLATINGSLLANTGAITLSNVATVSAVSEQTSTSTVNIQIQINEPVNHVENAFCKVDASNSIYNFDQATIAILDTNNGLSGYNESGMPVSNQGVIEVLGLPGVLNPLDVIVVKYNVQAHL